MAQRTTPAPPATAIAHADAGDPPRDFAERPRVRFVMKGGRVVRNDPSGWKSED